MEQKAGTLEELKKNKKVSPSEVRNTNHYKVEEKVATINRFLQATYRVWGF